MMATNALVLAALAVSCTSARNLHATNSTASPTTTCDLPKAFSSCGYEAFSSYGDASLDDATEKSWADGAVSTYLKRKGQSDSAYKVISVPLVCQNRYEDRVWGIVIEAEIDGSTTYLQARPYGSSSETTPDYDCISNVCIRHDDVSHCDRDDDDDDDDDHDDD